MLSGKHDHQLARAYLFNDNDQFHVLESSRSLSWPVQIDSATNFLCNRVSPTRLLLNPQPQQLWADHTFCSSQCHSIHPPPHLRFVNSIHKPQYALLWLRYFAILTWICLRLIIMGKAVDTPWMKGQTKKAAQQLTIDSQWILEPDEIWAIIMWLLCWRRPNHTFCPQLQTKTLLLLSGQSVSLFL